MGKYQMNIFFMVFPKNILNNFSSLGTSLNHTDVRGDFFKKIRL